MRDDVLEMWTIFLNPKDFPGKYVVRKFLVIAGQLEPKPAEHVDAVTDTLEEARKYVPFGLLNLGRDPRDEPIVVETWM